MFLILYILGMEEVNIDTVVKIDGDQQTFNKDAEYGGTLAIIRRIHKRINC